MGKFVITEEEKNNIRGMYEQSSNIGDMVKKSESSKLFDSFCKSKTDFDICLVEKSSDRSILEKQYNMKKNLLTTSGYSLIEESGLRQDSEGNYIRSSIWKKFD